MINSRMTITRILITTLVAVTTVVMTVSGIAYYYYNYKARSDGLHAHLASHVAQLSVALVNPLWTFNTTDIAKILESFMKEKEVSAVFVEDEKRFIGRTRDNSGEIVSLDRSIFLKGDYYSEENIIFNGEKIGVLGVTLTDIYMRKELRTSLLYLVVNFLILNVFLVSIVFFVLIRTVFGPLMSIEKYAIRVSTSSDTEDAQIVGKWFPRELESLKKSIQNMTTQLKIRYLELKKSQTALQETEKKYREIFNNSVEGIFQTTREGGLLTANPALAKILGYDSPEDILQSVADVGLELYVDSLDRAEFLQIINTQGRVKNFETDAFRKDKSVITVSVTAHSVYDENKNFLYYEGMLEDITQKRKADELKIAKEAAEETARAKNLFLASMSHEIRTPINAIMGLAGLAANTELTVKQQDYLQKIGSSAYDLLAIVNDILDFSKIEAGELNMDQVPFPLAEVWEYLSDIFAGKSAEKGVDLQFIKADDVPLILVGDPLRVRQILINLTGNALKFTKKGAITVRVGVEMKNSDHVLLQFSVQDTGIGIGRDMLSKIFMPFAQGESFITRKYGGTGLGLSICKKLVEMMGGDIWATSEPGQGACFTFTASFGLLPSETESELIRLELNGDTLVDKASLKGARILLVEDNSINRQVAAEILEGRGLIVEHAENGLEAVKKFSSGAAAGQGPFAAVLMDVQMPVMNGFEATKRIRQLELQQLEARGAKEEGLIPIIAMTAHAMLGDRDRCIESGMNDYLTKPIEPNRLFETLIRWIPARAHMVQASEDGSEAMATLHNKLEPDDCDPVTFDLSGTESLPGLDIVKGITRLEGNKKLYLKLLREFVINHADDMQKIQQALAVEDMDQAQRKIHTFKGVVQSISAEHLSEIAVHIENELRQGKPVPSSLFDEAQKRVSTVIGSIKTFAGAQQEESEELSLKTDIDAIKVAIVEMYQLLKTNRIDADRHLKSLKEYLSHSGLATFAGELDISFGQFDFKGARNILEQIAKELNISVEGLANEKPS